MNKIRTEKVPSLEQAVKKFLDDYDDRSYWGRVTPGASAKPIWRREVREMREALRIRLTTESGCSSIGSGGE